MFSQNQNNVSIASRVNEDISNMFRLNPTRVNLSLQQASRTNNSLGKSNETTLSQVWIALKAGIVSETLM